jgi:hypothetical protein
VGGQPADARTGSDEHDVLSIKAKPGHEIRDR